MRWEGPGKIVPGALEASRRIHISYCQIWNHGCRLEYIQDAGNVGEDSWAVVVWQTSASFRQGVDSLMKLGTTTSTTVKVKQLGHQRRKSCLYLLDGSELLHDSAQPQQSVTSRPGAFNLTGLSVRVPSNRMSTGPFRRRQGDGQAGEDRGPGHQGMGCDAYILLVLGVGSWSVLTRKPCLNR